MKKKLTFEQVVQEDHQKNIEFGELLETKPKLKKFKHFYDKSITFILREHKKLPADSYNRNMTLRCLGDALDHIMLCNCTENYVKMCK